MKLITILIMVALVGCTTREVIYQNQTFTNTNVIQKECSPCGPCTCTPCKKCPKVTEVVKDTTCPNKLILCNARLTSLDDNLFSCMQSNNTEFSDNLTYELGNCRDDNIELQDKLDEINDLI